MAQSNIPSPGNFNNSPTPESKPDSTTQQINQKLNNLLHSQAQYLLIELSRVDRLIRQQKAKSG